MVVDDDIGAAKVMKTSNRDQTGIARARSDHIDGRAPHG
jgi:hypothetical protein